MVMIVALIIMTMGALLITPTLCYVATAAKSTAIHKRLAQELYSAHAGIEYAMWCIKNDMTCDSPIVVNGIPVDISIGTLTELTYGPIITGGGEHVDWLLVYSDVVDNGDNTFFYTVNISNQAESGEPPIKLEQIGTGLPDEFVYVDYSSSGVTTADPQIDGTKLIWNLGSPKPELAYNESVNQTFLIQGTGVPQGYYCWVNASRQDVGTVSSCTGYQITAQAGNTTIESYAVRNDNCIYPISWEID